MAARFNSPPGWPPAPEGWAPPAGWVPDPSWPAPPPGWQLWIDDAVPAPGAPVPGAPVPGQVDDARFAGPDAGAPTQVFAAQGSPSPFEKQGDGAPSPFGATPPAQGGFGAPSLPPPGAWQTGPGNQPPAGAPSRGKQWLIPVIIAIVALAGIFGVLFATGVLGGDGSSSSTEKTTEKTTKKATDKPTEKATDKPTEKATDKPTEKATDKPTDEPSGSTNNGTRSAPLAPGEQATIYTWTVSMGATNLDAWSVIEPILSEYSVDNYRPEEGFVYVMAPVNVAFTGEDRGTIGYDLDWVFVGNKGTTYEDACGYVDLPEELDLYQELYTDATAAGNVCITVAADQADGGVWRVSSYGDYSETFEAYFGLS